MCAKLSLRDLGHGAGLRWGHRSRLGALAIAVLLATPATASAQARRADPQAWFPADSLLYASVDVGGVRDAFPQTPLGALLTHPGTLKALGGLPALAIEALRKETRGFKNEFGLDPLELADLFRGRLALALHARNFRQPPDAYTAVELGPKRAEILGLMDRIAVMLEKVGGEKPAPRQVRGQTVTTWQPGGSPQGLHWAVLGDDLLVAWSAGVDEVLERFSAQKDDQGLAPVIAAAKPYDGVEGKPLGLVFFNAKALRTVVQATLDSVPDAEARSRTAAKIEQVFGLLGLDTMSSVSYALAVRDGDWEGRLQLLSPGGLSGLPKTFAQSIGGPADLSVLEKIPASASIVSCSSLDTGRLVREIVAAVEKLPLNERDAKAVRGFLKAVEGATGLSLAEDVYKLPRLHVHSFQADPPAGGLIPDQYALVKASEAQPYLVVLERVARRLGGEIREFEVAGRSVAFLRVARILKGFGLGPEKLGPLADRETREALQMFDPDFSLAFVPLDEDWLLGADSVQAVERYLLVHAGAQKFGAGAWPKEALAKAAVAGKHPAFTVLRTSRGMLAVYSTVANLLQYFGPSVAELLGRFGVDPIHLPPAEEFLSKCGDGFIYLRATDEALVLHGHRVVSNMLGAAMPALVRAFVPAVAAAAEQRLR